MSLMHSKGVLILIHKNCFRNASLLHGSNYVLMPLNIWNCMNYAIILWIIKSHPFEWNTTLEFQSMNNQRIIQAMAGLHSAEHMKQFPIMCHNSTLILIFTLKWKSKPPCYATCITSVILSIYIFQILLTTSHLEFVTQRNKRTN